MLSAGALLTLDLDAVRANYRLLRQRAGAATCGAVLKADAYGLGAAAVAPALRREGCDTFFVAHLAEGTALRGILGPGVTIIVMHGLFPGTEAEALRHDLVPVVNSTEQLRDWAAFARAQGRPLPAWLQIDTGMARFGFSEGELEAAIAEARDLGSLALRCVMSHLACADTPAHPANARQLAEFHRLRRKLPPLPTSLAASSGIFLGPDWHGDTVRPGVALYGVAPTEGQPNPLRPVLRLDAKVVQLREVAAGTPVGYGHTAVTARPSRLATVAVGYADGFLRSASGRGVVRFRGLDLPILGRVSMDSLVVDATVLPPGAMRAGDTVALIGEGNDLDRVGRAAGTIGYEILTSLGHRYHRRTLGG
ncbi:alanine racemase [Roseomonas elaeocarpi]|uniref:Alanine racemase n=1 Tax=Roseomonas elaeocarpi TaxID=907779 RepID=A0ABV6JSR8_9PROT